MSDIISFEDFIKTFTIHRHTHEEDLMKMAWNAAIESACTAFEDNEGTDYCVRKSLTAK